jgi:hypothetical protein
MDAWKDYDNLFNILTQYVVYTWGGELPEVNQLNSLSFRSCLILRLLRRRAWKSHLHLPMRLGSYQVYLAISNLPRRHMSVGRCCVLHWACRQLNTEVGLAHLWYSPTLQVQQHKKQQQLGHELWNDWVDWQKPAALSPNNAVARAWPVT